jgi:hypothetical protein
MSTPSPVPTKSRKQAALRSLSKRKSLADPTAPVPVDLTQLVRVYLIDGSSKTLQMKESR